MPGKHFYQFYKNSEDYLKVMMSYFQAGLEKGQTCLWLVSNQLGVEKARQHAAAAIPDGDIYVMSGQFVVLSGEDWYLTNGRFDKEKAIANAARFLENSQKRGSKILRGAGDCACIPHADWGKVAEYEKEISPWVHAQPVIALCAYPILECTPTQTRAVLECHDDVLVGRF